MRPLLGSLGLSVLLLPAACGRPCDQAGLESAASTLDTADAEGRAKGIRQLVEACPTMPGPLLDALMAKYGNLAADQRSTVAAAYTQDPKWFALRRAACTATDEEVAKAYPDHEAVFEVCDFGRFGLASPERPFLTDDITAYVLLQWLLGQRNDPGRARAVVTPLLTASGDAGALWNRCLTEGTACELAMARRGIELPSSGASTNLRGSVVVELDRGAVRLDEEVSSPLTDGRAEAGAFEHHVHPVGLSALRARAARERALAEELMTEWDGRLLLLADRYAGWGTVADLLFTAVKAGFTELEVGVLADGQLRNLVVSPPRSWLRPPKWGWEPRQGGALGLTLEVERERLEMRWRDGRASFEARADCWDDPAGCFASPELATRVTELKAAYPHETVVTLRARADLPLQTIVSLTDTMRGPECSLDLVMMTDEAPPECRFWNPIVDLDPGLFWLIDQVDSLALGKGFARRPEGAAPGGRSPRSWRKSTRTTSPPFASASSKRPSSCASWAPARDSA